MRRKWLEQPARFARHCATWRPFAETHYSQEGEDLLLRRIFAGQRSGFYVDVGAHDPRRFSNTYWAYRQGWHGINIDAAPDSSRAFRRVRPRDVSVEVAIARTEGSVEFYVFEESALNTSGSARSAFIEGATGARSAKVAVLALPLSAVLDRYMPDPGQVIDLMSIDIEGSEMAALESNDWSRFRPRVLVLEVLGRTLQNLEASPEVTFLRDRGFTPVSMLFHSVILVSDSELMERHWGADQRAPSGPVLAGDAEDDDGRDSGDETVEAPG